MKEGSLHSDREVAKAHPSLLIDLPKKAPDGKQVLGKPDEFPGIGKDLETSLSSCDGLGRTVKPTFTRLRRFCCCFFFHPTSPKYFFAASSSPFTFLHALFAFLPLRFAQQVNGTCSFNMHIDEALIVIVRRRLVNQTLFTS